MLKLKYKKKYLKYKNKYLHIKSQIGGSESYLWYVEDQDEKFSLLNIYKAEQQNKITEIYNKYLWLGQKIFDGICIEEETDGNISIKFNKKKIKFIIFNYHYFNQGIKIFKLPNCMRFIENYLYNFFDLSDIDLISIGSGNGLFEKCCEDVFGKEIICIDPEPLSFLEYNLDRPFKDIAFNTVDDYLLSTTKKDKSILFLIWPDPNEAANEYDREAIFKLKPISFFIIYGLLPLAGSNYLRKLLYKNIKDITLRYGFEIEEYEQLAIFENTGRIDFTHVKQFFNIRMSVCIKKTISFNTLKLNKQQEEIKKKYPYCKQPLISKLSLDTKPIIESVDVGDIILS